MNAIPLNRAISIAGSQSALARQINVKQAHIWYWLKTGRVPAEYALAIEAATGGRVSCQELRPDIYPVSRFSSPTHEAA